MSIFTEGPRAPGSRLYPASPVLVPATCAARHCDKTKARGPRPTCPGSPCQLHTTEPYTPHTPEGGKLVQAQPCVSSLPLWTYLHRDRQEEEGQRCPAFPKSGRRCWRQAFCRPTPSPGLPASAGSISGIAALCDLRRPLDLSELSTGAEREARRTPFREICSSRYSRPRTRGHGRPDSSGGRVQEVGTFLIGPSFRVLTSDLGCSQESVP